MAARESGRIKETEKKRTLDEAARRRRQRKALEALEQDNFHDDPHGDLVMSKKIPKFQDNVESRIRKKKSKSIDYYKMKYRKSFFQLLEEDRNLPPETSNYTSAMAGPSNLPQRSFCAVCGSISTYTCIPCGAKYCCIRCLGTHMDTRCLKWTA